MKKLIIFISIIFSSTSSYGQFNIDGGRGSGSRTTVNRDTQKTITRKVEAIEKSALFVGNEISALNSFQMVFQYTAVQLAKPWKFKVGNLSVKNFGFAEHLNQSPITQTLKKYSWDYVILQGQAKQALNSPEDYIIKAKELGKKLTEQGSKLVLFMPWAADCSEEDTKKLFKVHHQLALDLNAILAPVGTAFVTAKKHEDKINLFLNDSDLPSPHGSYLAQAVLLTAITRQSTAGQKQLGLKSISKKEGLFLQKVATKTIKDYSKYLNKNK